MDVKINKILSRLIPNNKKPKAPIKITICTIEDSTEPTQLVALTAKFSIVLIADIMHSLQLNEG